MDVGGTIKKFRIANKLKQSELADMLQVTAQAVSSWERNRTQPNMKTIEKMCQIFKCKKSDFLDDAPMTFDSPIEFEIEWNRIGGGRHPLELTDFEYRMLLYFRALTKDKKDFIFEMLKLYHDKKDTD